MKKILKKRLGRGQKNLQLFSCLCVCAACSGCGSVPSTDGENVREYRYYNSSSNGKYS